MIAITTTIKAEASEVSVVVGGNVGAGMGNLVGAGMGSIVGLGDGWNVNATEAPDTDTESSVVTPAADASSASAVAKSPEDTAASTTAVIESVVALMASDPVTVTSKDRLASEDWSRLRRRRESCVQPVASTVEPLIVASVAAANTAASSAPSARRETRARARANQP